MSVPLSARPETVDISICTLNIDLDYFHENGCRHAPPRLFSLVVLGWLSGPDFRHLLLEVVF